MSDRRQVLEWLVASPFIAGPLAFSLGSQEANARSRTFRSSVDDAIAAWRQPGAGELDPRRYALAHAILAPNPHNLQPWLISLQGEDQITLSFDVTRRLPITDPLDRQLAIGCGAFLELLSISSAELGYQAQVELLPNGQSDQALDTRPLATIRLVNGGQKSPLFSSILARRSNKRAYDKGKSVAPQTLQSLIQDELPDNLKLHGVLKGDAICEALRSITKRAYRKEVETPLALKESVDLMRFGKREIAQHRDGIDLDFPLLTFLTATGQITREKMMQPGTMAYRQGLENYDPLADSAAGYVWITSADNTRFSQLKTGRAYAQLNLRATQLGLSMHPMSQALQEYEAMADIKREIDTLLNISGDNRLQMLARIGYGPRVGPAPRRGLAEHMVE
jgi:hypothetical protein